MPVIWYIESSANTSESLNSQMVCFNISVTSCVSLCAPTTVTWHTAERRKLKWPTSLFDSLGIKNIMCFAILHHWYGLQLNLWHWVLGILTLQPLLMLPQPSATQELFHAGNHREKGRGQRARVRKKQGKRSEMFLKGQLTSGIERLYTLFNARFRSVLAHWCDSQTHKSLGFCTAVYSKSFNTITKQWQVLFPWQDVCNFNKNCRSIQQ